ncbi:hypothetical protein RHGRI_038868 [Rhododendron griersonianum]|uniref:Uncharacterized protein n=1 Tax=Rhododendron griersonianum TaxID=479676 RepID=A0AAV6HI18_9ERIC|nr:hypothetical protein RHGRI_038868 [Rhododendron griersonianum]
MVVVVGWNGGGGGSGGGGGGGVVEVMVEWWCCGGGSDMEVEVGWSDRGGGGEVVEVVAVSWRLSDGGVMVAVSDGGRVMLYNGGHCCDGLEWWWRQWSDGFVMVALWWRRRRHGSGGTIPPSIGLLPNLWMVSLEENKLPGVVPPPLYNISTLTHLFIAGVIPFEIGKLGNMQQLDFSRNKLSGPIPSSISNLTQMYRLSLGENNLNSSLPSGSWHCVRLRAQFQIPLFSCPWLVCMSKCSELKDARTLLDAMSEPDVVSWSALVWGHARLASSH